MMKNIFTCSALVWGVACCTHIADATNDMKALSAMQIMGNSVDIWSYPSSDASSAISPGKSENASSSSSSSAPTKLDEDAKNKWAIMYRLNIKNVLDKNKANATKPDYRDAFTMTFAQGFARFFLNRTGKTIPQEALNLLYEHSFGNHINIINVVNALSANNSCRYFCEKSVADEIEMLISKNEIKWEKYARYGFDGLLSCDGLSKEPILDAVVAHNNFVRAFYDYFVSCQRYQEEIKKEFRRPIATTFSEGVGNAKNEQLALMKFLGNKAFFNISPGSSDLFAETLSELDKYTKSKRASNEGSIRKFIKFDLSNMLYVDTAQLMNEIDATEGIADPAELFKNKSAAAEFILCYHQYLYEEFALSEKRRKAFLHKVFCNKALANDDYFPYDRGELEVNFSVENDLSSLAINDENMRQAGKIFDVLSRDFKEMSKMDQATDYYALGVFINAVRMTLGLSKTTISLEEIKKYEDSFLSDNTIEVERRVDALSVKLTEIRRRGDALVAKFGQDRIGDNLPGNVRCLNNIITDWSHNFSRRFGAARFNVSILSKWDLGNEKMIQYLFGALDREIKSPYGDAVLIEESAAWLLQGFPNLFLFDMANALRIICHNLLAKDKNIKRVQDRLAASINVEMNNIFNEIFCFYDKNGDRCAEEKIDASNKIIVLGILKGKYGLLIPNAATLKDAAGLKSPKTLWRYYKTKVGTNGFVEKTFNRLFEYIDGLQTNGKLQSISSKEELFNSNPIYRRLIIPQLAKIAFSPENLAQKLAENATDGFRCAAELFVRDLSGDDEAEINWQRLEDDQKKQIALDILAYYGYLTSSNP